MKFFPSSISSLPEFILSLLWYLGTKIDTQKKFLRLIDDSFINVDGGKNPNFLEIANN